MSERKVLNKYYPPDFDPSKIPRARCPKNRKFAVRLMAPCNMKCLTCNEYIAQGKKFNARKEDVENMSYLGIRIYRFYIKCPGCLSEISFRTDPESTDYVLEAGAHRNFQALRLAEAQAAKEQQEAQDEIKSNPMLLLENRTQQSQHEMEVLESLEDLRELNDVHARLDLGKMAEKYQEAKQLTQEQEEEMLHQEYLKMKGYECVEGEWIKTIKRTGDSDEEEEREKKKLKASSSSIWNTFPATKKDTAKPKSSLLSGIIFKPKNDNDDQKTKDVGNSKIKTNGTNEVKVASVGGVENGTSSQKNDKESIKIPQTSSEPKPKVSALGMLGQYSGSESESD